MSALGEATLFALIADSDSLDVIVREGLDRQVIPTEALRPVYDFARGHFTKTGKAPTPAVLKQEFGDLLAEHEVDVESEVDESIEWAIDDLKAGFAIKASQQHSIDMGKALTEAETTEKVVVLSEHSAKLSQLVMNLMPRTTQIDLRHAAPDLLEEYEQAVASRGTIRGLRTGLPQIDQYLRGIWPGELGVVAGGPKVGKSFFLDWLALRSWEAGRIGCLVTLENSIQMTRLRLACQALHLSADDLYDGNLDDDDLDALQTWVHDTLGKSDVPFLIFNPELHNRNPHTIVEMARAYGGDDLFIDQLTFLDPTEQKHGRSRPNEIKDIMHALKGLISTGRHQMPCVLAHQIGRDGVKHAEKTGRLSMYHMAEGSEVERTADMLLSLYASADAAAIGRMTIQLLAARRVRFPVEWDLSWDIARGIAMVQNTVAIDTVEETA